MKRIRNWRAYPRWTLSQSAISLAIALLWASTGAMAQSAIPHVDADAPDAQRSNSSAGTLATFSYLQLAGSTFHPVSTPGSHIYSGAGCISNGPTASPLLHHKVLLPQGSQVKYVRLYYYNTSAAGGPTAFFTTYDAAGDFNERVTVSGAVGSGYGSLLSSEMSYIVDRFVEPINIAVNLGSTTDGSVRFCGVRIAYYASGDYPEIFKDGFES